MQNKTKNFDEISSKILSHPEYIRRKEFMHHENETVYDHCIMVAKLSYKWAIKLNANVENAVIGALLHDFYTTPWQENTKNEPLFKKHGFSHARTALNNSRKYFPELMNKKIENAILRHMFPLNIIPPIYLEAWIVNLADTYISLNILKHPKCILKYFGIRKRT